MKLTRIRGIGRYINPETGRAVNVHKGRRVGRSTDHLFFMRSGQRVFIDDADFYHNWKAEKVDADTIAVIKLIMKSKASSKCRECKGTGTMIPPPSYPPKRTTDVPRYKCTECNGTGQAQHFEMFFWHYDQFPYVCASRGFMRDDGLCYCPSYNACVRPFMVLPLKEGKELLAWLNDLTAEYNQTMQSVKQGFITRLRARVPKAGIKD